MALLDSPKPADMPLSKYCKRRPAWLCFLLLVFSVHTGLPAQDFPETLIEDVSSEDVKKFLDPTVMNSVLEYRFQTNFLPQDTKLFSHRPYVGYSFNHWSAAWAEVPIWDFSMPGTDSQAGISDTLIGVGFVPYKNLSKRLTAAAFWLEALAPTGNVGKGTGVGAWVLSPGGGIALNPSDKFPVYLTGRYLHSVKPIGGDKGDLNEPRAKIRSIELDIETVHILPKGFFVSAKPQFLFDLNKDFRMFSLGAGLGRALNRKLLVFGGYVHHVAGRKTFNQAFVVGLSFIWGKEKAKDQTKTIK